MKKTLFALCLFAAFGAFADNTAKMSAGELCSAMQDMRSYDWGQGAAKLEGYLYPLYRTATADKAAAALRRRGDPRRRLGHVKWKMLAELVGDAKTVHGVRLAHLGLLDEGAELFGFININE